MPIHPVLAPSTATHWTGQAIRDWANRPESSDSPPPKKKKRRKKSIYYLYRRSEMKPAPNRLAHAVCCKRRSVSAGMGGLIRKAFIQGPVQQAAVRPLQAHDSEFHCSALRERTVRQCDVRGSIWTATDGPDPSSRVPVQCVFASSCSVSAWSGTQQNDTRSVKGPSVWKSPKGGREWRECLMSLPVWNLRAVIWFHFTIFCTSANSHCFFYRVFFLLPDGPYSLFAPPPPRKFFNIFR